MYQDLTVTVDEYNLPSGILGDHPNEFYAAVGRVVCVGAVLEEKITTLRHTLEGADQGRFAHQPVSQQISAARKLAESLAEPAAEAVTTFLNRGATVIATRNAVVHSSFPAQPSGRLWGHRPARDRSVTDGRADTVETSVEALRHLIAELAELVRTFNAVLAMCPHRR